MTGTALPAVRLVNRGYTIIEVLIVLIIIGLAVSLAAPKFVRALPDSGRSAQDVVNLARRTAVNRAQTLSLTLGRDGAWSLDEPGALGRPLATGSVAPRAGSVRLAISPIGVCIPEESSDAESSTIDPVTCSVAASKGRRK